MTAIDSSSRGDPVCFRSFEELSQALEGMPPSSKDRGKVALLMRRGEGGRRDVQERMALDTDIGIPGDSWARARQRNPDMQIAVMERAVAELIAGGQPLALFGDCLILDLDLSAANLPSGTRLRIGGAILELTSVPHNGCQKFRARFGADALRLVWAPELRHRNLRGVYMRVVQPGEVALGDPAEVILRKVAAA
jgi:hypothetical protein